MSYAPGLFRPLAVYGWGGRDSFRGALCLGLPNLGLPTEDPQSLGPNWHGQIGCVIYRSVGVAANRALIGVTRDNLGAALGNCRVELYTTNDDMPKATKISDANGNFRFDAPGSGPFYVVQYLSGSPVKAGTTVNTLIATPV
jgi:hypothetical protein